MVMVVGVGVLVVGESGRLQGEGKNGRKYGEKWDPVRECSSWLTGTAILNLQFILPTSVLTSLLS